jgi:pimeloyl-ACP methyl ester carboxylesterase
MPQFNYNGHTLFYREQGSGPLLLILPGNTATSVCHSGELEHFGRSYHAVSLDFLGTGGSGRLAIWPDDWWAQGAHTAAALARHLGYSRCIVMGTSGGAIVALLTAILYPQLVRAVVADSTVEKFPVPVLSQEAVERSQRTPGQVAFWSWAQGEDWEQVVDADTAFLLRFEQLGADCFQGRLREIVCPVLLSASLSDTSLPDGETQLRGMARQIEGSRLFFTPHGEHPMMWSKKDDFRREAGRFLTEVSQAGFGK